MQSENVKEEAKDAKGAVVPILGHGPTPAQRRRARKEARGLLRSARKAVDRHSHRVSREARDEIVDAAAKLEAALSRDDHDATCEAMVRVDDLEARHLSFARKSAFREYADSIGVAVLVALLLRAFVVEAFKIPSSSMIPTLEVGDHIFVNKFIYGLRIPFTTIKFFEFRKPKRGEVIVFIYPVQPEKDFIKRIVAVEGDRVEVRKDRVFVNGQPVDARAVPGEQVYADLDESSDIWTHKRAVFVEENVDGETYVTAREPNRISRDFPLTADLFRREDGTTPCAARPDWCQVKDGEYLVPPGTVFVLGDNRNNSHDSRFWGPVPLENIKGKALVVWWSAGGPDGVRWNRLGKLVD